MGDNPMHSLQSPALKYYHVTVQVTVAVNIKRALYFLICIVSMDNHNLKIDIISAHIFHFLIAKFRFSIYTICNK